jgi:hypothetical protein
MAHEKNQDLNEMLQIKRQKLHDLKESGNDPHKIVNFKNRNSYQKKSKIISKNMRAKL